MVMLPDPFQEMGAWSGPEVKNGSGAEDGALGSDAGQSRRR